MTTAARVGFTATLSAALAAIPFAAPSFFNVSAAAKVGLYGLGVAIIIVGIGIGLLWPKLTPTRRFLSSLRIQSPITRAPPEFSANRVRIECAYVHFDNVEEHGFYTLSLLCSNATNEQIICEVEGRICIEGEDKSGLPLVTIAPEEQRAFAAFETKGVDLTQRLPDALRSTLLAKIGADEVFSLGLSELRVRFRKQRGHGRVEVPIWPALTCQRPKLPVVVGRVRSGTISIRLQPDPSSGRPLSQ